MRKVRSRRCWRCGDPLPQDLEDVLCEECSVEEYLSNDEEMREEWNDYDRKRFEAEMTKGKGNWRRGS